MIPRDIDLTEKRDFDDKLPLNIERKNPIPWKKDSGYVVNYGTEWMEISNITTVTNTTDLNSSTPTTFAWTYSGDTGNNIQITSTPNLRYINDTTSILSYTFNYNNTSWTNNFSSNYYLINTEGNLDMDEFLGYGSKLDKIFGRKPKEKNSKNYHITRCYLCNKPIVTLFGNCSCKKRRLGDDRDKIRTPRESHYRIFDEDVKEIPWITTKELKRRAMETRSKRNFSWYPTSDRNSKKQNLQDSCPWLSDMNWRSMDDYYKMLTEDTEGSFMLNYL